MHSAYQQSPLNKKVVLLIEDEDPFVELICTSLQEKGFRVAYATSCDQALDYLKKLQQVDAIWLDHYLANEKTGLDFLAEARKTEKGRTVPVFVASNSAEPARRLEYLKLGATEYYSKVAQPLEEVALALEKCVNQKQKVV